MSVQDSSPILSFDPRRLTLARELQGVRKSDLARSLGVSAVTITHWESGNRNPTKDNVYALALTLGVAPSFLESQFSEAPLISGAPHFRSLRSTTQLSRNQAQAYTQVVQDVVHTMNEYVDFPDLVLPNILTDSDLPGSEIPRLAAEQVRKDWGLGNKPVQHVVRAMENHGIVVVFAPFHSAAIDAYSTFGSEAPVVVLNPTKGDYYRQRFDAAHELGHLVMHADADPGHKVLEAQAHAFAAEFLAPSACIQDELPTVMNGQGWMKLKELKEYWGISMQALLYRAKELGRLSDDAYRNAMVTVSRNGWRSKEPGLISSLEEPSLIPHAISLIEESGVPSEILREKSRVPQHYFEVITARRPVLPVSV